MKTITLEIKVSDKKHAELTEIAKILYKRTLKGYLKNVVLGSVIK